MEKIRSVQVLRGFAAFLVVLTHVWGICFRTSSAPSFGRTLPVASFGGVGVAIFFCISGFIMIWTLKRDADHLKLAKRFFITRVKRIYPIYMIWLAIFLITVFVANAAGISFRSQVMSDATPGELVRNFLLLPALPGDPDGTFLPQAWTLVYEMYFYAVFAACLLAGRKYIGYTLPAAIVGLLLLSWLLGHPPRRNWTDVAYMIGDPLVLTFVLGALLAVAYRRWPVTLPDRTLKLAGLGVIAALVIAALTIKVGPRVLHVGLPSIAVLGVTVAYPVVRNRFNDALVYIGEASYSIYIVHIFVSFAAGKAVQVLPLPVDVVGLGFSLVAVAVGCLSYSFIEKPVAKLLSSRRTVPAPPGRTEPREASAQAAGTNG